MISVVDIPMRVTASVAASLSTSLFLLSSLLSVYCEQTMMSLLID
jgi:hypothetical protein